MMDQSSSQAAFQQSDINTNIKNMHKKTSWKHTQRL